MAILDDDNELGSILLAVVVGTFVVGGVILAINSYDDTTQVASRFPAAFEKTVPTIVPSQPQ